MFQGLIENDRNKVEKLVHQLLIICKNDLFVTPSDSGNMKRKYGYTRALYSAKHLLTSEADLQEFIDRSYKAKKNTQ